MLGFKMKYASVNKIQRPRVVRQQQFESAHIYGAVCPAIGKTEAIIAPCLSKDIMRQHLQLISNATELKKSINHPITVVFTRIKSCRTSNLSLEYIPLRSRTSKKIMFYKVDKLDHLINVNGIIDCGRH